MDRSGGHESLSGCCRVHALRWSCFKQPAHYRLFETGPASHSTPFPLPCGAQIGLFGEKTKNTLLLAAWLPGCVVLAYQALLA